MQRAMLRLFDVVISSCLLAALCPLLLLIALVCRVSQGSPVLYRATRVGRVGRPFQMLKFRTMVVGADRGPSSSGTGDARVTLIGSFLRRWKLDEFPQLINVIAGEMSLVGPRPQVAWAVEQYDDRTRHMLDVRPGMTDLASIWFRDENERLSDAEDPDEAYLRLIAPGKHALALVFAMNPSVRCYWQSLCLTAGALLGHQTEDRIVEIAGFNPEELAL
jgi:lipopolysaccharide/colanic/teichoic acid biosynthesis glycosyltransferase